MGKVLGLTALGLYQLSYTLSNLPATEITHVVSRVTFPAYSKLQEDLPRVRSAYLKVLQFISFLSFPLAGAIFIFLPDFVSIFLGDKWTPMVPAAQVLVMAGLLRSIAATTGPIFHALGKPKIDSKEYTCSKKKEYKPWMSANISIEVNKKIIYALHYV